jgi:hypothetical protein
MAREPKLIASEPTPGQRITELHCWVASYGNGTEGIIGANLPGLGLTALVSSRRAAAEGLAPFAQQVMKLSRDTKHPVTKIRLVTFTTTEGTRQ